MSFPFYQQLDAMDCGATCLRMIAKHYGKIYTLQALREKCFITREGVSMLGISDAAENIGFRTIGVRIDFEKLVAEAPLPCIVHWKQRHFVVVYKIERIRRGLTRIERIKQTECGLTRNKQTGRGLTQINTDKNQSNQRH